MKKENQNQIKNLTLEMRKGFKEVNDGFKELNKKIDNKIDELAIATQKGFEEIHGEINKKFEEVDRRFENVDKRFEEVDRRFDRVDMYIIGFGNRLDNVDDKIRVLKTKTGLK